jgi:hypothetical protein
MEQIKKLGDIFKDHYEKIILSVVLLALLVSAVLLSLRVSENRRTIQEARDRRERVPRQQSEPVSTAEAERLLQFVARPPAFTLDPQHSLFNPHVWKRTQNGDLLRIRTGEEEGPAGLALVETRPLLFRVSFDGVQASGDNLRYQFGVTDEAAGRSGRKVSRFLSPGQTVREVPFLLTRVVGEPASPTAVEIRFKDGNETFTVTSEQPFQRVAGFEAELRHDVLGGRQFRNVRAKQNLTLGSQAYNVVAITRDSLTLQHPATQKRWTVRLTDAP